MIKTQISVTVGLTHNLGDYSNFRPEVQISAQLLPGDNANICLQELLCDAKQQCFAQIDAVREAEGHSAHYSTEPRFELFYSKEEGVVFIVPVERHQEFMETCPGYTPRYSGNRLSAIKDLADKDFYEYTRIGIDRHQSLDFIPKLERISRRDADTCILLIKEGAGRQIPIYIQKHTEYLPLGAVNTERYVNSLLARTEKEIVIFGGSPEEVEELEKIEEFRALRERLAQNTNTENVQNEDDEDDPDEDDEDE